MGKRAPKEAYAGKLSFLRRILFPTQLLIFAGEYSDISEMNHPGGGIGGVQV